MDLKTAFGVSIGTLWEEVFSFWTKKFEFFSSSDRERIFFDLMAKHFWLFGYILSEDCQSFYSSWRTVWGNVFFSRQKGNFFKFLDTIEKIAGSCQKFLEGVVKNAFYESGGTFWVEKKPESFLFFLSVSDLGENFFGSWSCILRAHGNTFKFFALLEKIFVFQSLLQTEKKVFSLLAEFLRHGCQNCILRVRRSTSGKKFFFRKSFYIFIFSRHWEKKLHRCGKENVAFWLFIFVRVVKTAFYLFWRTVWGKFIPRKKI